MMNIPMIMTRYGYGILMLGTAAIAQAEIQGIYFAHQDWELACDNTGTCRAAGYHQDDELNHKISVLLTRKAGAQAAVTGKVTTSYKDGENTNEPSEMVLMINGKSYGKTSNHEGVLDTGQVEALLAAAKTHSSIEWRDNNQTVWRLSDKGMSAVLLKMDEFQQRIHTPSALMRPGNSRKAVLQPQPRPVVQAKRFIGVEEKWLFSSVKTKRLLNILRSSVAKGDCPLLFETNSNEREITVQAIDAKRKLVTGNCWLAAYNEGSGAWVMDNSLQKIHQLVSTNINFVDDAVVGFSHKGRGLGDCWHHQRWVWNGRRFVIVEEGGTEMCRSFPGGAWPLLLLVTVSDVRGLPEESSR